MVLPTTEIIEPHFFVIIKGANKKQSRLSHSVLDNYLGSIISVVGKATVEDYGAFSMYTKSPIRTIMKSDQTIIRKNS